MPEEEKSIVKGLSFGGITEDANATQVDVKDGKIVRIRPLHFDSKYKREDIKPWKIEARGKVFEASMKTLLPPFTLAYKNRVYSPNRTSSASSSFPARISAAALFERAFTIPCWSLSSEYMENDSSKNRTASS